MEKWEAVVEFVTPKPESGVEDVLRDLVYPGVFLPGRYGAKSPGKFVFEGKVMDERFSIRRITTNKWLYPMIDGAWRADNENIVITMRLDKSHIYQLQVITYCVTGSIGFAVGLVLMLGRLGGGQMISSYLTPVILLVVGYCFVRIIKGISWMRLEKDAIYLDKVLRGQGTLLILPSMHLSAK